MKFTKKDKIFLSFLIIVLAMQIILSSGFTPNSHNLYLNKTATTYPTSAAEFCVKCHPQEVKNVDNGTHRNAGCICHGYNPNFTQEYNLNLAHNLTKNIYCTNCHSSYDISTGNIIIYKDPSLGDISGINQSAHYIFNISSNKLEIYHKSKQYILNNTGG